MSVLVVKRYVLIIALKIIEIGQENVNVICKCYFVYESLIHLQWIVFVFARKMSGPDFDQPQTSLFSKHINTHMPVCVATIGGCRVSIYVQ